MITNKYFGNSPISRRQILHGATLAAAGSFAIAGAAGAAPAKLAPKMVSYQPTPKGSLRCDKCVQWQPPAACKVVSGTISPSGWCTLYALKP